MAPTAPSPPVLLLVEDSRDDAFFFKRIFQRSGIHFALHHEPNGTGAIEFLRKAAASDSLPTVIFLDLKMPVVNGFDVLNWMQTQSFFPKLPVIILSGSDHEADKERTAQLGAKEYWVKPVNQANLVRYLSEICPNAVTKDKTKHGAAH
jgi:CheY-like chemotaxis protein